jgi:hypothetical protein
MAIVINGSGTVTGLAVGGLPDGTVDAGTLATDSVTAAKLKDDAIAVGDLPAGSVLQVVSTASTTENTTTSTSFVTSGLTLSITPSATSSKIYISANFMGYNNTSTAITFYSLYRGSTELGGSSGMSLYRQQDTADEEVISMSYLDSPSSTSALTYAVYFKVSSGTGYVNKGAGAMKGSITVMEIAG